MRWLFSLPSVLLNTANDERKTALSVFYTARIALRYEYRPESKITVDCFLYDVTFHKWSGISVLTAGLSASGEGLSPHSVEFSPYSHAVFLWHPPLLLLLFIFRSPEWSLAFVLLLEFCVRLLSSLVDIATRYGLDDQGIESRWGRDFSSLLYNGYRVFFPGVKRPGRGVNHPPHLMPRLKKE